MKAILLATGDTYRVITNNEEKYRYLLEDGNWYNISEIELLENDVDWQQVRIELAGKAMQGIISGYSNWDACMLDWYKDGQKHTYPNGIANFAVACADALIVELKGGQND